MPIYTCKLCGNGFDESIRNHLIPDFANRIVRERFGGDLQLLRVDTGALKPQPGGIYDTGLFCGKCEHTFGTWEQKTAEFIRNAPNGWHRALETDGKEVIAWHVDQSLYEPLKLFSLATLYRLHVSRRSEARDISLDDIHGPAIAKLLLARSPGAQSDYPVIVYRYSESKKAPGEECGISLTPIAKAFDRSMYQFDMCGMAFRIFVDSQAPTSEILLFSLAPGGPCHVIEGPYDNSARDKAVARGLLKNASYVHPRKRH